MIFIRFMISAAKFDDGTGQVLDEIAAAYGDAAPVTVWKPVRNVVRRFGFLISLMRPFEKKLGRDLRHALYIYKSLKKAQSHYSGLARNG